MNYFIGGEIDWIGNHTMVPPEYMEKAAEYKDFHADAYLADYFYWVNTQKPPTNDARVRKALSLAIDRKAIVDHVTKGKQIPSSDFVPEWIGWISWIEEFNF